MEKEKAEEHPTENVEYLKAAGKLSYTLLTPINPRSICWLWIEVATPLDAHQTCSVRIEIDFIDDYMAGSDGEEFPIEMGNFGFKELKAFKAFPVLLDIFSSVHGSMCSVADFCKKLEAAGIKGNYDPETCYYYTGHEKEKIMFDEMWYFNPQGEEVKKMMKRIMQRYFQRQNDN